MKKLHVLLLVFLAIFLASTVSANPLPFLEKKDLGKLSPQQSFIKLYALPDENSRKVGFFTEIEKNLGLDDRQLSNTVNDPSKVRVVEYTTAMPSLVTAGIIEDQVFYWRKVKAGEKLALFYIDDEWRPAFLLRCANPIKVVVPRPLPKSEVVIGKNQYNGCWQTGPSLYVQYYDIGAFGTAIHGTGFFNRPPQYGSIFTPTRCSGERFIEENGEERK